MFNIGTAGAGTGALTANLKGGLGSASLVLRSGHTIGALVGANGTGIATAGERANFWAAPNEIDGEFGGLGTWPHPVPFLESALTKRDYAENPIANTTIAIIATDADREGEMIAREILDLCSYRGPIQRLWLSALNDASIRKALGALKPSAETLSLYYSALARSRADWLIGMNPLETEKIWAVLYNALRDQGQRGLTLTALSGIDIALWDIKGKHFGASVSTLLGGRF
eukprot:gene3063-4026_t